MQNLAVPAQGTSNAHYPSHRLVDGGYTEVTSAAFNLGRMQADCSAGKFDCSDGLRLIIFNHCHQKSSTSSCDAAFTQLFTIPGYAPGQVSDVGAATSFPGNLAPTPTIFAEKLSDLVGWKTYVPSEDNAGFPGSRYWLGTVTTVSNSWFDVQGGETVRVALFQPQQHLPTDASPLPEVNPDASYLDQIIQKLEIELGGYVQAAFGDTTQVQDQVYGPPNELQETALMPILRDFLAS